MTEPESTPERDWPEEYGALGYLTNATGLPPQPSDEESFPDSPYNPKNKAALHGRGGVIQMTADGQLRTATEEETEEYERARRAKNAKRNKEKKAS